MAIFVFLIVISITMYFFYKTKYFRSKQAVEKRWLSAKSSIALGLFVFFFGVDQLVLWDSVTSRLVGFVFALYGGLSIYRGYKAYRHYLPLAIEEAESLKKGS